MHSIRKLGTFISLALICIRAAAGEIFTPEACEELTGRYEMHPESVSNQQLMQVALCYNILKKPDRAAPLLVRYLKVKPNDELALRGLGTIYVLLEDKFDEGAKLLRKAWSFGDTEALKILAGASLRTARYSELRDLIPSIDEQRSKDPELTDMLVYYSLRKQPPDKALFTKVVGEMDDAEIFQHKTVIDFVLEGLEKFGETNRAATLRAKLSHWPKDDIDSKDLTPEHLGEIIKQYESHPDAWPEKSLLQVAIAYAMERKIEQAEPLYRRFLKMEPDNPRALRGLGGLYFMQEQFLEAIPPLKKAWSIGDIESLSMLAASELLTGKINETRELVPSLLKHKGENIEFVNWLVSYSLKTEPPDKEVFLKAIDALTDEAILRREDTTGFVITGLEKFGFDGRARLLKKKAKELGVRKELPGKSLN